MGSVTNHNMFEALFERRLKPEGAFADALLRAGYDRASPKRRYPTSVWIACLEVARRHGCSATTREEAYRQLGREFAEGFLTTTAGALIAAALPFMSPQAFINRLASYFRISREDERLTFDVVEEGAGLSRVVVHNPAAVPGTFVAGLIETALGRIPVEVSVEVRQSSEADYELIARWQ